MTRSHLFLDALTALKGATLLQRMWIVSGAMVALAAVEWLVAVIANSLALKGIALHMGCDALLTSANAWVMWKGQQGSTSKYTAGFDKLKSLIAWINGLVLIAISVWMVMGVVQRWGQPQHIEAGLAAIASVAGFLTNALCWLYLREEGKEDVNAKAAALDMLADMLGDSGSLCGSLIMSIGQWFNQSWYAVDLWVSLGIAALIAFHSWHELIVPNWETLLDKCPKQIDYLQVKQSVELIIGSERLICLRIMRRGERQVYIRCSVRTELFECHEKLSTELTAFFAKLVFDKEMSMNLDLTFHPHM
jgi:cobalt-zinc-cadmium efflux system protein